MNGQSGTWRIHRGAFSLVTGAVTGPFGLGAGWGREYRGNRPAGRAREFDRMAPGDGRRLRTGRLSTVVLRGWKVCETGRRPPSPDPDNAGEGSPPCRFPSARTALLPVAISDGTAERPKDLAERERMPLRSWPAREERRTRRPTENACEIPVGGPARKHARISASTLTTAPPRPLSTACTGPAPARATGRAAASSTGADHHPACPGIRRNVRRAVRPCRRSREALPSGTELGRAASPVPGPRSRPVRCAGTKPIRGLSA